MSNQLEKYLLVGGCCAGKYVNVHKYQDSITMHSIEGVPGIVPCEYNPHAIPSPEPTCITKCSEYVRRVHTPNHAPVLGVYHTVFAERSLTYFEIMDALAEAYAHSKDPVAKKELTVRRKRLIAAKAMVLVWNTLEKYGVDSRTSIFQYSDDVQFAIEFGIESDVPNLMDGQLVDMDKAYEEYLKACEYLKKTK